MNLNDLEYFNSICEHKSFTKAAEHLHISQPSLSITVNRLEKELGIELLIRNKKKKEIILTPVGEIFYNHSVHIINEVNNAVKEIQSFSDNKIKLGLPQIIGAYFFPPILSGLIEKYPEFKYEIVEDGSIKLLERVGKGEIDLAILTYNGTDVENVNFHKLKTEELYVCTSKKHEFSNKTSVSLKNTESENYILLNKDFSHNKLVLDAFKEVSINPKIILTSDKIQTVKYMIASNIGISIMMGMALSLSKDDINMIPIDDLDLKLDIVVCFKKNKTLSTTAKKVLDFIISNSTQV